jgi:cell shape-determining protein MreC
VKEIALKPFSKIHTTFKSKSSLENRIKELEEENARLKISQISQTFVNQQIEDYNLELEKNSNGMISKVLNRPPYSSYDTLLILKKENNIEVGDIAFVRGVYIGDVESVNMNTAIIKLRSTAGEKTLVRISEMEIEAEGKGGGQFYIKIPKDSAISIGDAVTVPLLNYSLLGSVGQVIEDPVATFKTVYFSIPVAFQDMDFVSIVKKESVLE